MSAIFDALNKTTLSGFSRSIVVVRQNGADTTTRGIFDSRFFEVEGEGNVAVSALITTVAVDLDETGEIDTTDRIAIDSTLYRVVDQRPDGQGMTILELEKVDA